MYWLALVVFFTVSAPSAFGQTGIANVLVKKGGAT